MKSTFLFLFFLIFVSENLCQNKVTTDSIKSIVDINDSLFCESSDVTECDVYEVGPEVIKQVNPIYPDSAKQFGIEGTVYVKVRVDTSGKPSKVCVIKSDNEIFNLPAVQASWQYIFTPALMNEKPIRVNVTIPFKFKLDKKKE